MLVLSRKLNQSIQIGDDIEVKIISIEGDQVKIGIEAPKHIDIHRKEVYLSIQEENSRLCEFICRSPLSIILTKKVRIFLSDSAILLHVSVWMFTIYMKL